MDFNEIYSQALSYTEKKLPFLKVKADAAELISEAYLLCEGEITLEKLKVQINKVFSVVKYDAVKNIRSQHYNLHHHLLEKACSKCRDVLPIAMFYEVKTDQFSFHLNSCNECRKKENNLRTQKWYYRNVEAISEKRKIRYAKHAGREKQRARKNRPRRNLLRNERRKINVQKLQNTSVKSGIKNIYFDKGELVWVAKKTINGKKFRFGSSKDLEKTKEILKKGVESLQY